MPALTIRRPRAATVAPRRHPKATISSEDGTRLVLPFAPNDVDHGGLADTYETQERPGRKPLVTYTADGLRTFATTVLLAHRDHHQPVEGLIATLRELAEDGARLAVSLSALERGVWTLTDASIRTELRAPGTNAVTRATASLTFTEAVDAVVNVGPLSGGKKKKKGKGKAGKAGAGKGKRNVRRYTVKAGDTLARIALKFYDDPGEWRRIARASDLRDPRKLRPGMVLTIPPEE